MVVVELFRRLCIVLPSYCPLALQNRAQRDDSAHFENHCSSGTAHLRT